jgi:hypothetical protein
MEAGRIRWQISLDLETNPPACCIIPREYLVQAPPVLLILFV